MAERISPQRGPKQPALVVVLGALILAVLPGLVGANSMSAPGGPRLYGPFEQYWKANGGVARFGLPLTGVFPYGDYAAQWLERAVFIYNPKNPDPYRVQQQNLGWIVAASRCTETPFQSARSTGAGQFFGVTGHNLTGKFLTYWRTKGGLASFGYPISEAFTERNRANGKDYLVQYFERARMELHLEAAGTANEVQLGLIGAERLANEGGATAFERLTPPAFYPATATAPSTSSRPGVYPKTGAAPDYSWVAGSVADLGTRSGPGPERMGPTFPPTVHTGPGPIFAPPPSLPTTYPNGVTVGTAARSDTSPPLASIPPSQPVPACSAMTADSFMPIGPVWEREKAKLKDGDFVVIFGHLASPGETSAPTGDRGRPYIVDRVVANR